MKDQIIQMLTSKNEQDISFAFGILKSTKDNNLLSEINKWYHIYLKNCTSIRLEEGAKIEYLGNDILWGNILKN